MKSIASILLSTLVCVACGDDSGTGGNGGTGARGGAGGEGATGASGGNGSGGGGSAQGGGGSGQGGTATGGGSEGGGGASSAAPECTTDEDCYLSSDCCECAGRPNGEDPPGCAIDCFIDQCASASIDKARCAAGRRVTDASCDDSTVTCDIPTPQCGENQAPIVSGSCYAGGCLDVLECEVVTSCAVCAGVPGSACVRDVDFSTQTHCVDLAGCASADCACLGDSVCIGSFDLCNESVDGIDCSCPTC